MAEPDVMTLRDVAVFLQVHPNTVYRLARTGRIPAFKLGTDWRFRRSSIEEWARTGRPDAGTPSGRENDDVFHLVYWLVSEGFALSATVRELASLLDRSERSILGELRRLARAGLIVLRDREEVSLSPDGVSEGWRRYARRRKAPSGHQSVVSFAMRHAGAH